MATERSTFTTIEKNDTLKIGYYNGIYTAVGNIGVNGDISVPISSAMTFELIDFKSAGTTTSTTADKLVDSGATFSTDGVTAGMTVYNSTDDELATVTAVDSETQLSISSDIIVSGENYVVCSSPGLPDGFTTMNGKTVSDSDSPFNGLVIPVRTPATIETIKRHYKLNETSGTDINDSGFDGQNGTTTGGTVGVTGKINNAYNMVDGGDYLTLPTLNYIQSSSFSVAFWANTNNTHTSTGNDTGLFESGTVTTGFYWAINQNATGASTFIMRVPIFDGASNIDILASGSLNEGTWYHFIITYDSTTNLFTLYVDGSSVDSGTWSGTGGVNTGTARFVGGSTGGRPVDWDLDDARFYNYVLSQSEIDDIYNSGTGTEDFVSGSSANTYIMRYK